MKVSVARFKRACVIACLLNGAGVVGAAPVAHSGSGELTLAGAVQATLVGNPDLAAGAFELKSADARITQAAARPNPEISLELDGIAGRGLAASPDERQATLSLSQVLELGNKRGSRVAVATSGRELAAVEQQARQLDALAEVTRRFVDVVAAQEKVALARETRGLTEQTAKAIATRVEAARTPLAELSRAQIALTRARADERQAESALRGARRTLTAMWGEVGPAFTAARADLMMLGPLDSFESLQARMDRNPELVRFASEARLREAEWRLAQSQSRPNLTVGVGLRRFQATGDVGFTTGVSIALPLFDRNQGAIAESRARRQQAALQEKAARIRVNAQLFSLYQQVLSDRDLLNTLQSEVLPRARAALEQTQYGYDRGRFSYLELGVAQQELVSLRVTLIDTAADYHRLVAEVERLCAEPVSNLGEELP